VPDRVTARVWPVPGEGEERVSVRACGAGAAGAGQGRGAVPVGPGCAALPPGTACGGQLAVVTTWASQPMPLPATTRTRVTSWRCSPRSPRSDI